MSMTYSEMANCVKFRCIGMKMKVLSFGRGALLACGLFLPLVAEAQYFPSTETMASLLQKRVDNGQAVGIVLGVLEADGSTTVVAAGDAGPGSKALDERSVFEIGSVTKVFTGTLLAEMVRQGKLRLSDPVSRYLPSVAASPPGQALSVTALLSFGEEVTLLDLATHHSGLPYSPGNLRPADLSNIYADYSTTDMAAFLSAHGLKKTFGVGYEYSNLGVGLLGHVLANVHGSSYEDALREVVLEPLGMHMTGIELNSQMREWMAQGHNMHGEVVHLVDAPAIPGAGALRSNARDMLRFLAANVSEPTTPLQEAMRSAHVPQHTIDPKTSIGLVWHIRKTNNSKIVTHRGFTLGFRSFAGFDPVQRVGVVVLGNSAQSIDDIGWHLIDKDIPLSPPRAIVKRAEIAVATDVLRSYVGEYAFDASGSATTAIKVTLEAGALFGQPAGRVKYPLHAETASRFFTKALDAWVTFQRSDDGSVDSLILSVNGQMLSGKRVR